MRDEGEDSRRRRDITTCCVSINFFGKKVCLRMKTFLLLFECYLRRDEMKATRRRRKRFNNLMKEKIRIRKVYTIYYLQYKKDHSQTS